MARLNTKLLIILGVITVVVLTVGGVLFYLYKFQDPVPLYEKGVALLDQAEKAEAEIDALVTDIADPCAAYQRRRTLREERTEDLWRDTQRSLGQAYHHSRRNMEIRLAALEAMERMHLARGNYDGWLSVLETRLRVDSTDAEAAFELARFFHEMARSAGPQAWVNTWPMVVTRAETFLELQPDDPCGIRMLAEGTLMTVAAGISTDPRADLARVEEILAPVLEADAGDIEARAILARKAMIEANETRVQQERAAHHAEALEHLQAAIEAYPQSADAHLNLYEIYRFPLVDDRYRTAFNVAAGPERDTLLAVASEHLRQTATDLADTADKFPQDGRFKVFQAQLRLRSEMSFASLTDAINFIEQALETPNADITWRLRLADNYRRRADYRIDPPTDLRAAYDVLWAFLYHPRIIEPRGPEQTMLRQTRFTAIQLMIDVCADLARLSDDARRRYLATGNEFLQEFTETLGEEEVVTRISAGTMRLAEGDITEAVRLLYSAHTTLAEGGGDDARLRLRLFRALRHTDYTDLALRFGRQAIEAGLNGPAVILEYMRVVLDGEPRRTQIEGLLELMDAFESAYAESPELIEDQFRQMRAEALLRLERRDEARAVLERVDNRDRRWQVLHAQTLPNPDDRAAALTDMLAEQPDDMVIVTSLFGYHMTRGQEDRAHYDRARQVVDAALAARPEELMLKRMAATLNEPDPNNIPPQRARELSQQILENIADPFERDRQLASFFSDSAREARQRNDNAAAQRWYNEAKRRYESALRTAPDDPAQHDSVLRGHFNLALAMEDWTGAEAILTSLGADRPILRLEFEADMLMARGQYEQVIPILERYLRQRPVSSRAHMALAEAYLNLGQVRNSVNSARRAVEQRPRDVQANRVLAVALHDLYRQRGLANLSESDLIEIIRPIDTVLSSAPNLQEMRLRMIYYPLLAGYYSRQAGAVGLARQHRQLLTERVDELMGGAIATADFLVQVEPTNAEYWRQLATIHLNYAELVTDPARAQELTAQAENVYQRAIAGNPTNASLQAAYGLLLRSQGREQEAEELMAAMVAGAPEGEAGWAEARLHRAGMHIMSGEYERAETLLGEILATQPENTAALAGLADLYVQQDRYAEASQTYQRLRDINDNETLLAQHIETTILSGDLETAEGLLAESRAEHSNKVWWLLLQSRGQRARGDIEAAVGYTERALALADDSNYHVAALMQAESLYLVNRLPEALDTLIALRNRQPDGSNVGRFLLAQTYWRLGRRADAVTELQITLLNEPADANARRQLVQMLQAEQRWLDVERLYEDAIQQFPDMIEWPLEAGQTYLGRMAQLNEAGDRVQAQRAGQRAEEWLNQALQMSREQGRRRVEALSAVMSLLKHRGQYPQVVAMVDENLTDDPVDAVLLMRKAEALYAMDDKPRALTVLDEALDKVSQSPQLSEFFLNNVAGVGDLDTLIDWSQAKLAAQPDSLLLRVLLSNLYAQKGLFAEQIEVLTPALDTAGPALRERIQGMLAVAYGQVGRHDEAIAIYRELMAAAPHNVNYLNNLAYLLLKTDRHIDEGVELAGRAYARAGDSTHVMDTYSVALITQQRYAEAEEVLRRAIELSLSQQQRVMGELYLHLGQALAGQERWSEAREALTLALENGLTDSDRELAESLLTDLPTAVAGN